MTPQSIHTEGFARHLRWLAFLAVALAASACGSSEKPGARLLPPAGLTYAVNPAVYTAGKPIIPNQPWRSGGAVAAYEVSPALPAGLSLNTDTGVLSGMPIAASEAAIDTIAAANAAGSTTAGARARLGGWLGRPSSSRTPRCAGALRAFAASPQVERLTHFTGAEHLVNPDHERTNGWNVG
jgi:hypothetical protein